MSETPPVDATVRVNIEAWINKAKADPIAYLERQATEVLLVALSMTNPYGHEIFLKGGILMGVVYGSPRQTGDIDFTAISEPRPEIADDLKTALNEAFPRASIKLGYLDLMCSEFRRVDAARIQLANVA